MDEQSIQEKFQGDSRSRGATIYCRAEALESLLTLQKQVQKVEGAPTEIMAEIKFNIAGSDAKQYVYSVTVSGSQFDEEVFAASLLEARAAPHSSVARISQLSVTPTDGRSGSRRREENDDVLEASPLKRPRLIPGENMAIRSQGRNNVESTPEVPHSPTSRKDDILSYLKEWHGEWHSQGGWLYDTLTRVATAHANNKSAFEKNLTEVQEVLGRSINTASANNMAELTNVTKLIPWLEQCRKVNDDKAQTREEKWRTSSATFHDQARRDRERAERRLEEKLDAQHQLLLQLLGRNDYDLNESRHNDKEGGLGAQLTAELNIEAARAKNSDKDRVEAEIVSSDEGT